VRWAAPVLVALLFCASSLLAQTITGTVKDADGTLSGVVIKVKGSNKGAISDKSGKYSLAVAPEDKTLVFNLVGYAKKEVAIEGRSTIDVVMSLDLQKLNDVVVVGYGTQSKRDLTGNIAKVKASDIADMPVPTFDQAMQGKAAGVVISSGSGKVGGGVQIRVRGSSSLTASNEPLYVLDGVIISSVQGAFNSTGVVGTNGSPNGGIASNPLVDLNPQDIESIDILKDAAAAAIYGSRGANGVVIITTKKGKSGTARVNFSFQQGFSEASRLMSWMNSAQYVSYMRQSAANADRRDGVDPKDPDSNTFYIEDYFNTMGATTFDPANPSKVDTDWQKAVLRSAPYTQMDFNVSGGNDKTSFYASGQYLNQTGIIVGNALNRFTGRVNVEQKVGELLKIGFNASVARTVNNRLPGDNAFSSPLQAVALSPISPLKDPRTGLTIGTPPGDVNIPVYYNPLIEVENTTRALTVLRNIGLAYAQVDIIEGLYARGEFGYDFTSQDDQRFFSSKSRRNQTRAPRGLGELLTGKIENINLTAFLNYSKTFDVNTIEATAGVSYQRSQTRDARLESLDFPSDEFRQLVAGARKTDATTSQTDFAFASYFGRAKYKLMDKYIVSASLRVDGSSRFGANNRYGLFPAASAAWIITQEDFLKDNETVNLLKLRASYGRTGNAEVGNFAARGLVAGDASYATQPGTRPATLANPNLTWETTDQVDLGLEFGLFDSRITGEVAVYEKQTSGLLLNVPVPYSTGFNSQTQNIGRMQNRGIEFVLNTENVKTEDFTWRTNFNIAYNDNQIIEMGGQIIQGGQTNMSRAEKGLAIASFFTPEYAGVNPDNGDALWYRNTLVNGVRDRTTTNNYNNATRIFAGLGIAPLNAGITNTFSFGGFDFSFLFTGVFGNKINFYGVGRFSSANGRFEDNQTTDQLNSWRADNKNTNIPEARLFANNGAQPSTRFIQDGQFIRLRNATISYTLPKSVLEGIGVNNVRVFVSGQNLLLFLSNYTGWDPEVNTDFLADNISQGTDFYTAPQPRTVTFGINIGF
jgi:TonB-linked SusC/RagA family outer membrane protein